MSAAQQTRWPLTELDEQAALSYYFDADSKGDCDVRVFGKSMVTAGRDYPEGTCFPCMGPIRKGERHRVERGLMDGQARSVRSCAACCTAMAAAYHCLDFDAIERRYSLGRAWHKHRAAIAKATGSAA